MSDKNVTLIERIQVIVQVERGEAARQSVRRALMEAGWGLCVDVDPPAQAVMGQGDSSVTHWPASARKPKG